jgi:hypothetical protein
MDKKAYPRFGGGPRETKTVPQRLKPRCERGIFGTAEAVPLSKTDFFCNL